MKNPSTIRFVVLGLVALLAGFASARALRFQPGSPAPEPGFQATPGPEISVAETIAPPSDAERERLGPITAAVRSGDMEKALLLFAAIEDRDLKINIAYEMLALFRPKDYMAFFDLFLEIESSNDHPLRGIFDQNRFGAVVMAAIERWAELDSRSLFDYITDPDADDDVEGLALFGVPFLAARAPDLARRLVEDYGKGGWFEPTEELFVIGLAIESPQKALRHLVENGTEFEEFDGLFAFGTGEDPSATVALIEQIEDIDTRKMAVCAYVQAWAHADPVAAFEFAMRAPRFDEGSHALLRSGVLEIAARTDPVPMLEHLEATDPRWMVFVAHEWLGIDPDNAALWVREHLSPEEMPALLSQFPRDEAIRILKALPRQERGKIFDPGTAGDPFGGLLFAEDLAVQDLDAFVDALMSVEDAKLRNTTLIDYSDSLARSDIDRAAILGLSLAESGDRRRFFSSWSEEAAYHDPERGSEILASLPASIREQVGANFFDIWAREDPVAATSHALAHHGEREVRHAVNTWAESDPEKAFDWLCREQPNPQLIDETRVIEIWVAEDPAAAAATAMALPVDMRGPTTEKVIGAWAAADPEGVRTWAAAIADGDVSAAVLELIGPSP